VSVASSDEAHGLPLDRFVAERAALVKALRAGGEPANAARVAALRKPTVAAWAVNQLVRPQAGVTAALFESGEEFAVAQLDLLAGRIGADALRAATARQRATIEERPEAVRGLLSAGGQGAGSATLGSVADTLRAAALDERAPAQVKDGCLRRELHHAGVGDAAVDTLSALADERPARRDSARETARLRPSTCSAPPAPDREARARAADEEGRNVGARRAARQG
jgi:hypothetical protein